jgi:hypothetical protein
MTRFSRENASPGEKPVRRKISFPLFGNSSATDAAAPLKSISAWLARKQQAAVRRGCTALAAKGVACY